MGNLSIRRLDEETIRRLRLRAARNGRSMEEETRRIIRQAVATPERIGDLAVFGRRAHGRLAQELAARRGTGRGVPAQVTGAMVRRHCQGEVPRFPGAGPLGELPTIADVAQMVLFFTVPESQHLSGQVVAVDSGQVMTR